MAPEPLLAALIEPLTFRPPLPPPPTDCASMPNASEFPVNTLPVTSFVTAPAFPPVPPDPPTPTLIAPDPVCAPLIDPLTLNPLAPPPPATDCASTPADPVPDVCTLPDTVLLTVPAIPPLPPDPPIP